MPRLLPPAPPYRPPPPPFTHNAFTTRLLYQKVTETFHEALKTKAKKMTLFWYLFPIFALGSYSH